jgi:tape measure domain-containing protein
MGRVQSSLVLNDQMSKVLGRINKAMGLVLDSFEAVQRASGKSFNTENIAATRREIGAANAGLKEMEESYREINNQQQKFNRRINQSTTDAGVLLGKIKGVASAYLGMKSVTALVGLSDTMTQTDARLSMMNDGKQSNEELNNMIYASAQRSRGSYLGTADTVSKLGLMAGDAFSSNKETIAFMEQVNKQFKIAGTSAQGIDAAMLQLTQAMGSGVLRGEEYNSILEQAPNIIQSIAKYMDVPTGKLKDMAADGQITADIVKSAMFACADETNAKFESMPMTWNDVWTSMQNQAIKALDPVLVKINELANSESVQQTVDELLNGFSAVTAVLAQVFEGVCAVYNFVAGNWSWIAPIIGGIVTMLLLYNGALLVNNAIQGISNGLKTVAAIAAVAHGTVTAAEAASTTGMTAAQVALNAALYACPLTWIIVAIIAVIAVIYAVIAIINKVTGSTISATGVILGTLAAAGAFIWDLVLAVFELVLGVIERLVNPFITIANFIANVFRDPVGSVIELFGSMADQVLAVLQKIASAMDFIFGSNMASAVQGWRNSLSTKIEVATQKYGNGKYEEVMSALDLSVEDIGLKRIAYSDAWNKGYSAGEKLEDKLGNYFSFDSISQGAENLDLYGNGSTLGDIAKNTGDTAKNTGKTTEELSYLRDIAEREAINRFTTAEIKVDMSGMNNRIDSNMDLDGIISYLTDGVAEALVTASEGVY